MLTVLYCASMIDRNVLQDVLSSSSDSLIDPLNSPLLLKFDPGEEGQNLFNCLFSGKLIVWEQDNQNLYSLDISNQPTRSPEESTMELSLKGPRDGFVESVDINLALVRKRLRTPKLQVERFNIGSDSQTQVCLLFMIDLAPPEVIEEAKRRLNSIDIKALHGSGELEVLIADRSLAMFPLVDYTGRPDFVVQSLMNTRFALLVDGSPSAIIAPANMSLLVKSPEDSTLPYYFVSFERFLRLIGLMLAGFLPGFWIALLAFNTDQIPLPLLATVTVSRTGLPMSSQMEIFLMMLMFELFREAGIRLPRAVGQTVTVVGGLIVGDAAIRAGLTSPTMLVVAAVTAVATFTLVNQTLNGSVTVIRLYILFASATLGLFGFFLSMFSVFIYLCSLESFGVPYLQPIAPFNPHKVLTAILQLPWKIRAKRSG